MSRARFLIALLCVAGVVVLAVVTYLAFGDLGRHKARLEALVTQKIGRPFAIDGAFHLRVLPSIEILAERVRVGNAAWGSTPQMLEIGRVSARIGIWSLISGPVDVRAFELSDASAVLERDAEGRTNWVFGDARGAGMRADSADVPMVIRGGKLQNVRVAIRDHGNPEHVASLETLTLATSPAGLLTISGKGRLDDDPVALEGELGPLAALRAGRDMRVELKAGVGEISATVNGTLRSPGLEGSDLRLGLSAPSLARLRPGLPSIPVSMSGRYAASRDTIELKDLKGRVGESDVSGRASMARTGKRRIELELASPRLDLTPFLAGEGKPTPKAKPQAAKKRFIFSETPLPLDTLQGVNARLHLAAAELHLLSGWFRDVDGTLVIEDGRLALAARAQGGVQGTLEGSLTLAPAGGDGADLKIEIAAQDVRAGFEADRAIKPEEVPPTSIEAKLRAKGASARQMAAGASGRILVIQKRGKIETGIVTQLGGDVLSELAGKVNPFASKDPYSELECTVARADIVAGEASVKPFLFQTEKVAVVADGRIDLRTEALELGFTTRPRKGVGISAGMFTNPFIGLGGTLSDPSLVVGARGAASGAAAVATGGMSLLAQGLFDRLRGVQDQCKTALDEATTGR